MVCSERSEIMPLVQSLADYLSNGTVESVSLPTSFVAVLEKSYLLFGVSAAYEPDVDVNSFASFMIRFCKRREWRDSPC